MCTSGISASDLANAIGNSLPEFLLVLDGQVRTLPPHKIMALASVLKVSQAWLACGVGPMHSSGSAAVNLKPGQNLLWAIGSVFRKQVNLASGMPDTPTQ